MYMPLGRPPKNTLDDIVAKASVVGWNCLEPEYKSFNSPWTFSCKAKNHVFTRWPKDMLPNSKCRQCEKDDLYVEFKAIIESKGGQLIETEFLGNKVKHRITCKNGHDFLMTPGNLKFLDHWCDRCLNDSLRDPNGLEKLHSFAKDHPGSKCLAEKYINIDTKYPFVCGNHGPFNISLYSLKLGQWCRKCADEKNGLNSRKPEKLKELEEFVKNKGGTLISTEWQTAHDKYTVHCGVKEHEPFSRIYTEFINRNAWCIACGIKNRRNPNGINDINTKTNNRAHLAKNETEFKGMNANYDFVFEPCGHVANCNASNVVYNKTGCPKCALPISKPQREIYEFIINIVPLQEEVILSDRKVLDRKELDIYVPKRNFAIEFDGLFYHSAAVETMGKKYDPNKGIKKFRLCQEKGIKLLAIFEDEWKDPQKRELIKTMIKYRLGLFDGTRLFARKLTLKRLDKNIQFKTFFEQNHLDGHTNASFAYGLFLGDELVMCASVRTNHQSEKEIARLAVNQKYSVAGGAGRLIKAIKNELGPEVPLVTFSNNRLSFGNTYKQLGFEMVRINSPSYYYTDGTVRVWRFKCRRINNPEILSKYPTERAQARGGVFSRKYLGHDLPLYEIHDYGHIKWILR